MLSRCPMPSCLSCSRESVWRSVVTCWGTPAVTIALTEETGSEQDTNRVSFPESILGSFASSWSAVAFLPFWYTGFDHIWSGWSCWSDSLLFCRSKIQPWWHVGMCGENKLEVSSWKLEELITTCRSSLFRIFPFCIVSVSLPTSVLPENNQCLFLLKTTLPSS